MKKFILTLLLAGCVDSSITDRAFRPATRTELSWIDPRLTVVDSWAGTVTRGNNQTTNVVCIKAYGERVAPRWFLWKNGQYIDLKDVSVTCRA